MWPCTITKLINLRFLQSPPLFISLRQPPSASQDRLPTTNNFVANFVLGQIDFTTTTAGSTLSKFDMPQQVSTHSGKFIVTDYNNSRVLAWNTIPNGNASADIIVGANPVNRACSATTLYDPESAMVASGKLVIADNTNNRVLLYNPIPTSNNASPDTIPGQASLTQCTANNDDQDTFPDAGPTARTLYNPTAAWTDGTRLVVSDATNYRVLIWNSFPTTGFQATDLASGQT